MPRQLDHRQRPSMLVVGFIVLALFGVLGWAAGVLPPAPLLPIAIGGGVLLAVISQIDGHYRDQLPAQLPEGLTRHSNKEAEGLVDGVPVRYRVEALEASPSGYLDVTVPVPRGIAVHAGAESHSNWLGIKHTGDMRTLLSLFDDEARRLMRTVTKQGWQLEDGHLFFTFAVAGNADADLMVQLADPLALAKRLQATADKPIGERLRDRVVSDPDPMVRLRALKAMTDEELTLLPALDEARLEVELALRQDDVEALRHFAGSTDAAVRMVASQRLQLLVSKDPTLQGAVSLPVEAMGALSLATDKGRALRRTKEREG